MITSNSREGSNPSAGDSASKQGAERVGNGARAKGWGRSLDCAVIVPVLIVTQRYNGGLTASP